jgi:hypothetical protein
MTNNDKRVLGRRGARIVTGNETSLVNGGFITQTECSIGPRGPDCDVNTGDFNN